ncbi:hypothetical protein PV328_005881 [Microctonus aethiopoides]|uniref:Phosphoacetylglucosamine mutase n=1 Tax=Microctonus aethiopoides TaxID=144406 RepID=A0AA39FNE2_9HYME|nr:hypothetical protein PV328_005881 [Microctonus aethiopoides]
MNYSEIHNISVTQYPNKCSRKFEYGTAGFRTRAEYLDHLLFRMGILAVLRSKVKGAAVGLMITASHNEEPDNGVKLVDPNGEMLETKWETIATSLANAPDSEIVETLKKIVNDNNIDENASAVVILGRDSRQSGVGLSRSAIIGIKATNAIVKDFGVITTPQLHYFVVCINTNGAYGEATTNGYISKLCRAFIKAKDSNTKNFYSKKLFVDAANGVGAIVTKALQKELKDFLEINLFNDGTGTLNHQCGADYVKINQVAPINSPTISNARCATIDGDADRIVYYYNDENGKFHLLDGDKIATLIASYIKDLIEISGLSILLGLVQTAYANGASTNYISGLLNIPVACTDTGVKYLHQRAHEFDIGVYFEANGHGTVIFKDKTVELIQEAATNNTCTESQRKAALQLCNLINIVNQTVGDALSDMLIVETILDARDWDIVTWNRSYIDFPNRQVKVHVKDRNVIKTTDAARRCLSPPGLQEKIDELVSRYSKGRSFVRPSGTEDVVRVYAEAENSADADKLAGEVSLAVYQLAHGVGPMPNVPL